MNRINILDCTLRDGGYINEFHFGESVIKDIVCKLTKASIEIIECGFLKSGAFDKDKSLFGSIESVKNIIGEKNPNLMYVAMIQYGGISNNEISDCKGDSIDGIRLTFHEHEIEPAFVLGKQLMDKGYKVFMQPVGTMTYTDKELLALIEQINTLKPFAFYMVDTLGTMYSTDLRRMFYLVDNNLEKNIVLGFHSHNNLQLSFANAQELMQMSTTRTLIIDSSVYGMGRGAGNLNTELVTQYINTNIGLRYDNLEVLEIIDEYIKPLSLQYMWGYDVAYYIASITGCHPNYATYLINKQTLHTQGIYAILNSLEMDKRPLFDKRYIVEQYKNYMNHYVDDEMVQLKVKKLIGNKKVLLIAPGKSIVNNTDRINHLIETREYFTISVNFVPKEFKIDTAFVSNMKRFQGIQNLQTSVSDTTSILITSNIVVDENANISVLDYSSYLNEDTCIVDNAGLMCINFMKKIGVKEIVLAGFDGFSTVAKDNYFETALYLSVEEENAINMNLAIEKKMEQLKTNIKITYLTDSKYE